MPIIAMCLVRRYHVIALAFSITTPLEVLTPIKLAPCRADKEEEYTTALIARRVACAVCEEQTVFA